MPDSWTYAPVYLQIMRRVKLDIVSGAWQPGERIPPVRELALEYQVNPNTIQRALAELERENLLYTERTAGRFVTEDGQRITELRREMAEGVLQGAFRQLSSMGFGEEEIRRLLHEWQPVQKAD